MASSDEAARPAMAGYRVLEFFSGIGGMRASLYGALADGAAAQAGPAGRDALDFAAFDSSNVVNDVYSHNVRTGALHGTGESSPNRLNIEGLRESDLDGRAEIWTMSPPCQPFTTTKDALRKDMGDMRNKAFINLMDVLQRLKSPPKWIFMENVKGFVDSETHHRWTKVLVACGYGFRQFLLNPIQFRIPNNRMRFYMACCLGAGPEDGFESDQAVVVNTVSACDCPSVRTLQVHGKSLDVTFNDSIDAPLNKLHELGEDGVSGPPGTNPLSEFVLADAELGEELGSLMIPDEKLQKKWAMGLSYIGREDCCTFCFTSSYGNTMHKSSGSLFHVERPRGKLLNKEEDMSRENSGKVRRFSPRELLSLFAFPDDFTFPPEMPNGQRFRAIGQSINVAAVRALMHGELCRAASRSRSASGGAPQAKRQKTDAAP